MGVEEELESIRGWRDLQPLLDLEVGADWGQGERDD